MLNIFNTTEDVYYYKLSDDDIAETYALLYYYSNINNVKVASLSSIWTNIEEVYHIRSETSKMKFAIDFICKRINFVEFIDAITIWENGLDCDADVTANCKLTNWFEKNNSLPEDLEWSFEFYDSY